MRYILLFALTLGLIPAYAQAEENIRGIFFENNSPHMLGIRLINRNKRVEQHHIFEANTKAHVDTKLEQFTLSAQLLTPSFPIDCCEWKLIRSGDTLIIEYLEERQRCYCKVK